VVVSSMEWNSKDFCLRPNGLTSEDAPGPSGCDRKSAATIDAERRVAGTVHRLPYSGGGLAQLVTSLVASTKLINAGPG